MCGDATPTNARQRIDSLDALRGLVMVVMALDHTRDFFSTSAMDARDVANPALFLTRWVTHFCAPVFVFGPSIGLLALLDAGVGRLGRPLVTVGRVPLFYYVLHLYLIHATAIAVTLAVGGSLATLRDGFHPMFKEPEFGFPLPVVYVVWLGVVLALYPLCRWFAGVKQRRSEWWLSYL